MGWGPGVIKIPDNVFYFFFLVVLHLFTDCQWFISKKIIIFRGSRGAETNFPGWGGPTSSRRGGGGGPIAYSLLNPI